MSVLPTDRPPEVPARLVKDFAPSLLANEAHHLCPGCGEPIAMRAIAEMIEELALAARAVAVVGIGCYTGFARAADLDTVQALHGRAPSLATGIKRVRPECCVFTLQGDGDMVNEGLQEVLHTAARGERVTAVLLNNGVFGETGGHMTATTVLGQRTKNTLEGREAAQHGYPIPIADLVARLEGAAFVARGAVDNAANVSRTRRILRRAFEYQMAGAGFSFVEILTMCPTGWFLETTQAPEYLGETMAGTYRLGVVKQPEAGAR